MPIRARSSEINRHPEADTQGVMSFGDHLEALRSVILRILAITLLAGALVFCLKEQVFAIVMAPLSADFVTFGWIRTLLASMGGSLAVEGTPQLIATDISSQFMAHLSVSLYAGLLLASPYILYSLLGFVLPALYENEKRCATKLCCIIYILFIAGLLLCYFIMFPIACRFLSTYSVSAQVTTMIDISSYLDMFISLSLLLGAVFQLPVALYFLAKAGLIDAGMLRAHRRHALVAAAVLAAIITPPDALTLILVAVPLYALFEAGIIVVGKVGVKSGITSFQ